MPPSSTARALVAACLAALALLGIAPAAAPAQSEAPPPAAETDPTDPRGPTLPDGFVGIASQDLFKGDASYRRRTYAEHAELGIRTIRLPLEWRHVETRRHHYYWGQFDALVGDAARQGLRVLPVLIDPPRFRSRQPRRRALRGYYPPRRYGDLGRFAARAVQRYGTGGSFWRAHPDLRPVPIRSWQVWNEPNLPFYWRPKTSPEQYTRMLQVVAEAIIGADPEAEIVTAGLPASTQGIPLTTYIRRMYRAGAAGSFDALGVNAYSPTSRGVIRVLANVRRIMDAYGDRVARLWATELSWSDVGPGSRFKAGRAGQAARIRDVIVRMGHARAWLNLRGFVYYTWRDLPVYAGGKDFWGLHTGLLDIRGRRKPAYGAFAEAVRQLR